MLPGAITNNNTVEEEEQGRREGVEQGVIGEFGGGLFGGEELKKRERSSFVRNNNTNDSDCLNSMGVFDVSSPSSSLSSRPGVGNGGVGTVDVNASSSSNTNTPTVTSNSTVNTSDYAKKEAVQPQQEVESRTVMIRGIDPNTPDGVLREQFECFGDIQSLSVEGKLQGYIVITYHDIRAARLALHSSGTQWRGRKLTCTMVVYGGDGVQQPHTFSHHHHNHPGVLGKLYLVSLDGGRSLDDVYYLLSSYGELKELRRDPVKPHSCCIAEFYDGRHAAAAYNALKASPELSDRLLILDGSYSSHKELVGDESPNVTQQTQYSSLNFNQQRESISDMTRNLSEISLESNRSQQQPYQSMMGRGPPASWSAEQIWRSTSYSGDSTSRLGTSPPSIGSQQWHSSSNEILAALHAQQRAALQMQAFQNSLMNSSNTSVVDPVYTSQMGRMQTARRNQSDPGLGGRLARRQMHPIAEAERKAQQDRMYGLDMGKILSGEDKRTTLMIKNIPNKYTQKMLLTLLEERFAGTHPFPFDFFYLPIDFKNKCNVGYAFINMTTPMAIPALVDDFHGRRWPKFNSEKVCQIAYGRIQGKLALIQHFQNSSLLHEDKRCRPVLFDVNGEVETFPIGPAALASFSLKHHSAEVAKNEPNH
jgi:hypothetical protein